MFYPLSSTLILRRFPQISPFRMRSSLCCQVALLVHSCLLLFVIFLLCPG